MKRIDFLGVPGTGKSTICNELVKVRSSFEDYCFPQEARRIIEAKALLQKKSIKNKAAGYLISNRFFSSFFKKSLYTGFSLKEELNAFYEKNGEFLSVCAMCVSEKVDSPNHKLLGATWLTKIIAEYHFLNRSINYDLKVVFDESLSQKIFGVSDVLNFKYELVSRYFKTMPKPDGLIIVKGDVSTIKRRLFGRTKINTGHIKLNEKEISTWIENANKLVDLGEIVLKDRNIRTVEVPASNDPQTNARLIYEFIQDI